MKSLSSGRLPWIFPAYFKKTQASKLGDAQGIPSFIVKIIRSSLVKLYFYSFTSYVLFLKRLCAFIFSMLFLFLWSTWVDPSILDWERDMLRFFIRILLFFTYICWVFISSVVQLLALVFMYLLSELLAFFCRKYSLASLIFVWRVDEINWLVFGWFRKCRMWKLV